jgi:hypothetical protein
MRTPVLWIVLAAAAALPSRALAQTSDAGEPLPGLPAPAPASATAPATAPAPATTTATVTVTATESPPPTPAAEPSPAAPATPCSCSGRHDGFYLRFSSGFGYQSVSGDGPFGSASVSGIESIGGLAIGGTIAKGVALAGTIWAATTTATFNGGPFSGATIAPSGRGPTAAASGDATASLAELALLVDWYPDPAGGWHAGGSAGVGATGVTTQADGSRMGSLVAAGSVFGGYDFWVGRSWSLGLALILAGASSATLNDTNGNSTGYRMMPLSIGLQTSILYY